MKTEETVTLKGDYDVEIQNAEKKGQPGPTGKYRKRKTSNTCTVDN